MTTDANPYANPAEWWAARGTEAQSPHFVSKPAHFRAEAVIAEFLFNLNFRTIFEAGCGKGRIAYLLKRIRPNASYTAIDVGRNQLAETAYLRPEANLAEGNLLTYESDQTYDLVVCSEVLMHIRPEEVSEAIRRLRALVTPRTGYLLTVDWFPMRDVHSAAYWNWPHPYIDLFTQERLMIIRSEQTDEQRVFLLRPV